MLSEMDDIAPTSVHAYIIGEHVAVTSGVQDGAGADDALVRQTCNEASGQQRGVVRRQGGEQGAHEEETNEQDDEAAARQLARRG